MNVLGNLGDPNKVAAALKPLIEGAEDKALAELHATVSVTITQLQETLNTAISTVKQELEDTRIVMVEQVQALLQSLPGLIKLAVETAVEELQRTTVSFGRTKE